MSTRSITILESDGIEVAVFYRHCDGYPTGHGDELAQFLAGKRVVNGISGDPRTVFNGPAAVAAQVVAHFTDAEKTGEFYLYPAGTRGMGEEYTYSVAATSAEGFGGDGAITLTCAGYDGRTLYQGSPDGFDGSGLEE